MEINQELLINLIKERPVLWDKTLEEYKNKRFTYDAWKDLCQLLEPSFDKMDLEQQNEYGKSVMKKWTNMRDSWIKYSKKECKADLTSKPKKYVFYEQMSFLKKLADPQPAAPAEQSASTDNSNASNEFSFNHCPKKRTKKLPEFNNNDLEKKLISLLASREQESQSRAMHFFKSIAPTVESFTEDELVDFQYQVMETIKNIKSGVRTIFQSSTWNQGQIQNNVKGNHDQSNQSGYIDNSENDLETFRRHFQVMFHENSGELSEASLARPASTQSFAESNDSVYSAMDIFDLNVQESIDILNHIT